MKILVISDNHGDDKVVDKILKKEVFDISIHLGDSEFSEEWIKQRFTHYVPGNHDSYNVGEEQVINIDGIKTMILHGHTRGIYVFTQTKPIEKILNHERYDLILHGHSHIYRDDMIRETRVICPGSTTLPRSSEGKGYIIIETEEGKIKSSNFKNI